VQWIAQLNYSVDAARAAAFNTGIRPKLAGPAAVAADFVIDGPETHGVPGLVNLSSIEPPGLTASLAISQAETSMFS
jgi:L-2-hydroxyglutarate oxidase LhgO